MKHVSVFAAFALSVVNASAALVINYMELGPDVIMTGSGLLDLSGMTYGGTSSNGYGTFVNPSTQRIYNSNSAGNIDAYIGAFTATPFGTGGVTNATSHSGDGFLIAGSGLLWVPENYVAAPYSLLFGQTYAGHSFASMGLTPGTYIYTLPSDTFTVVVGPIAPVIPEPSTYIALAGFAGLGLFLWRRRVKAKSAS